MGDAVAHLTRPDHTNSLNAHRPAFRRVSGPTIPALSAVVQGPVNIAILINCPH